MSSLRKSILVSALFTLFGGPAFLLGYFPYTLTQFRIPPGQAPGHLLTSVLLIAAGLGPLLESIVRFIVVGHGTLVPTSPTEHLVVSGLYRFVRNPMYIGVLTAILGQGLLFASRSMIEYFAIVFVGFHLFVCAYEEPTLRRRYPVEYPRYSQHVRRWLPRLSPWTGGESA
jgi:protein-S-isoprenylcysteine O-methyltransferase Ste14